VFPETWQAVKLFAMMKGYSVREATFRAIRTGIFYELQPADTHESRRVEQLSCIVGVLIGRIAKNLNVTEEKVEKALNSEIMG